MEWTSNKYTLNEVEAMGEDIEEIRTLVPSVKLNIQEIKSQLAQCEIHQHAILISRVIRGVQKVFLHSPHYFFNLLMSTPLCWNIHRL